MLQIRPPLINGEKDCQVLFLVGGQTPCFWAQGFAPKGYRMIILQQDGAYTNI
jgi:hypothetical protein